MGERGIQLRSLEDSYRFASAVLASQLAPTSFKTPEAVMVAVQYGLELGMTPMKALQSIAVVNGRPTIWGDAALGMVKASGLCEYCKEWTEGDGEDMVAFVETKRKDEPEPVKTSFSVKDAKIAGLWGKQGPWKQYPQRMLKYRARAFNLRDNFPDVMGGMHLGEEFDVVKPEQAYETRTPPRELRKPVESVQLPPSPSQPAEPPAPNADQATIKGMINGLMKTFFEKLPATLDPQQLDEHFRDLAAFVCGGSKADYVGPANWTLDNCQKILRELEKGVPQEILETIKWQDNA